MSVTVEQAQRMYRLQRELGALGIELLEAGERDVAQRIGIAASGVYNALGQTPFGHDLSKIFPTPSDEERDPR